MNLDWRSKLVRALGRDITDRQWEWLVEGGHIGELDATPDRFDTKVAELAEMLATWRRRPQMEATRRPPPEMSRAGAVSRVYAVMAAEDDDVIAFRQSALEGRLLTMGELEPWILSAKERDQGATRLVQVVVDQKRVTHGEDGTFRLEPPVSGPITQFNTRSLAYPKGGWTHHVIVSIGGALDRLRALSESLGGRYGWQPAQATAFVLTGAVPVLDSVRARASTIWPTGLVRISLDVDPRVSPGERAGTYSKVRQHTVGNRHRDLSAKHLRLAVFLAEAPADSMWSQRMDAWNKEFSSRRGWAYQRPSIFARDARRALDRVLGKDLVL